ncbi:hypothetical protein QFC22_000179 [Naganishia vaughanmartiniae]|uniref:Uncharacterized protein n=1 Tax=Naganishia vaughanmartiniae TaxID=1424756 RepID=A0ACC2XP53_9TREE|nr:hypothetical protein QFC22_000179 [Naganishia vaughanmartiniae]
MTACVQSMHLNFGRRVMGSKQNVPYSNPWQTAGKANVMLEDEMDIRFTFNIWHQPARTTEEAHEKTPVQPVSKASPFAWLPLLPLETVPQPPSASPLVGTGVPLSPQQADDDLDVLSRASSRGTSVTETVDNEPARKKQRVSAPIKRNVELTTLAEERDEIRTGPEIRDERCQALAIRRVRMRDVDAVEDFLDQYLPEFGTGVPMRILLGSSGVAALAIQPEPHRINSQERILDPTISSSPLDQSLPILALVIYRKTRSGSESVISHMQAIAVHPASRRLGLGQQLVSEALRDSMQEVEVQERTALSKVTLRAEGYEGNGSREFWQRCIAGLKVSSRRFGCRRGWTGEAQLPCTI